MHSLFSIFGILSIVIYSVIPEIGAQKKRAEQTLVDVDPPKIEWTLED